MSKATHVHRKSDRMNNHAESFRVSGRALWANPMPDRLLCRNAIARERGQVQYTTESRLCACGKVALRVWKNVGYCKAHAPERVA